jgi:organic radical activating enzyme
MSPAQVETERRVLDSSEASALLRRPRLPPGNLLISEVFGPTVQGEGAHTGQAASFVRLGACPLACSWCDTAYAWRPDLVGPDNQFEVASIDAVARQVVGIGVSRLVVTGGEPTLQRAAVADLARAVARHGVASEVETAGIRDPGALLGVVELFTVSPKLANSGMPPSRRLRWPVLQRYASAPSVFKFVATAVDDLGEIEEIVNRLELPPRRVFVCAEGTDAASQLDLSRALAAHVLGRGWGLSTRWHLHLWGDQRGR